MAEQAGGVVIAAAALPEGEGGVQHAVLVGGELGLGDLCLGQPCGKTVHRGRHDETSLKAEQGVV